jgi:parallel beta-helix repeat protein
MAVVSLQPGQSIQAAIDANPEGTTFQLASGVWHQQYIAPKSWDAFIGASDGSTVLDGDYVTPVLAHSGSGAVGVWLKDLTVQHYVPGFQAGVVHGVDGWTITDSTFQYNYGDGVDPGANSRIYGGHYLHNAGDGIQGWHADNLIIRGAEIAYNDTANLHLDDYAAGIKLVTSSNVDISYNYVHDNNGHGIWADLLATNWTIDHNWVYNNAGYGIQWEISDGVTISNNTVVGSQWTGIFIGEGANANIYGNNVTVPSEAPYPELAGGIIFQSMPRAGEVTTQNIQVHDNTVTYLGDIGVDGFRNYDGSVGGGNYAYNNHYYAATGAPHWEWGNHTPLDFNTYLSYVQDGSSTLDYGYYSF